MLGEDGNLNNAIGKLVERHGLSRDVQRALDIVRVIGNNAVHPGEINVADDPSVVASLFRLVNLIVDQTISRQKQIEGLYGVLPSGTKAAIEERDARTKPGQDN